MISIPVVVTRVLESSWSPIDTDESEMGVMDTLGRTLVPPLSLEDKGPAMEDAGWSFFCGLFPFSESGPRARETLKPPTSPPSPSSGLESERRLFSDLIATLSFSVAAGWRGGGRSDHSYCSPSWEGFGPQAGRRPG